MQQSEEPNAPIDDGPKSDWIVQVLVENFETKKLQINKVMLKGVSKETADSWVRQVLYKEGFQSHDGQRYFPDQFIKIIVEDANGKID